ncbi:MAG: chemotaxis-specific protein-glutamate methyltransferase CheB [Thermodesulfobacteriota bacterium]
MSQDNNKLDAASNRQELPSRGKSSAGRTSGSKAITVLLVDDSLLALTGLKKLLATVPGIEVVGTARNGKEALALIPELDPKVICTDLHMPVMDGLAFTGAVMGAFPRPILVVSVSVEEGSLNVFRLLDAGAIDVCAKPLGGFDQEASAFAAELASKIKIAAGVHVVRKAMPAGPIAREPAAHPQKLVTWPTPVRVVVVGASTGGPHVLRQIFSSLPANFPIPVVCVQHIAEGFSQGLVEWLSSQCRVRVTTARRGGIPEGGTVYFSPEGVHLQFNEQGQFATSAGPAVNGHRPSVTVLMESAARVYGNTAAGILLTGMGDDGAQGMRAIHLAGGMTIVQDEASSVVFGMPKQAIALGVARFVMPPEKIAAALKQLG